MALMAKMTPEILEAIRREMIFQSLHKAHIKAWDRGSGLAGYFRTCEAFSQHHAWRMEWWRELERGFPDKIKNGVTVPCPLTTRSSLFYQTRP